DTSDDDDGADDDNRISRPVRLHDHEARASSCSVTEESVLRRSPRLLQQPQRPRYSRLTKSTLTEPTFGTCCLEGRIVLPNLRVPPEEFIKLLEGTDEVAKSFRENIRR
ncbi:hypothetical protein MKW92_009309, partial [Papaver armeniacum]